MEEKEMRKSLSFENTRRLLERKSKVRDKLMNLVYDGICDSIKDATSQVNKQVYEMAEKQGVSIWDICFSFVPEYSTEMPEYDYERMGQFTVKGIVKLVPLELEFEKGPGYWKNKYLRLKEKIQNIINEREEKK